MAGPNRRAEIEDKIRRLQQALGEEDQKTPREVTLKSIADQVHNSEVRLLNRLSLTSKHMAEEHEDQAVAGVMVNALVVFLGFYVLYIAIDALLRLRRCRCPTEGMLHDIVYRAVIAAQPAPAPAAAAVPAPAAPAAVPAA